MILLLLALCAGASAPPTQFNIRDYGATGRRADDATASLAKAIRAARAAGGGTVQVPPGDYTCLGIVLYDNITLQLDAGAVLYADLQNPAFVDNSGFIYAENARNIAIRGRGRIDGQAAYRWGEYTTPDGEIEAEAAIARQAGVEMKRSYRTGKSAFTVLFKECEGIVLEDITIENSSLWAVRLWGSSQVAVRNVTIRSDLALGVNSDGIDLDGTRNAHITGCTVSTGDDAICLKSGRWKTGQEKTYPTENILVDNCLLTSSSAALKIGSETFSPIRHVLFSNCIIRNANRGISINVQDGATVSDVVFSNLSIDLKRRHWNWWGSGEVFAFALKKRRPESPVGGIRNITLENVTAYAQGTSQITAPVDKPLENIRISNLRVFMQPEATPDKRTAHAMRIEQVEGLTLQDVAVHWDEAAPEPGWQSGLVLSRVRNFRLRNVSLRQAHRASDRPALSLSDCTDGLVSECTAQPGTGTYLHISGADTRRLTLHANHLAAARRPLRLDKTLPRHAVARLPPAR